MIDLGMLGFLLVAIAIGFYLGRRSNVNPEDENDHRLQSHYIRGLNYLLNEQPDAAIDTFIDALEVNVETLETHLALGNLLRKRGEVGRAIKVHQNLLARPSLSTTQLHHVQLELARDYIKSGLLDRAETLLQELVDITEGSVRTTCLEYLIEIYRDEKEWLKGIEAINQLVGRFTRLPEQWLAVQSHFYCELAEEALRNSDLLKARRFLKGAMSANKNSVRASLILAALERRLGNELEAIRLLKMIPTQDVDRVPEMLPMLVDSYKAIDRTDGLKKYLLSLLSHSASSEVVLALSELIAVDKGEQAAAVFIGEHVSKFPSLKGVSRFLEMQLSSGGANDGLVLADEAIRGLYRAHQPYRCKQCGFVGQQLHWLCPSCKAWGTVKVVE